MANTAKHNRDEVIQKATWLFWEKGFHATSMRDLQDRVDMRPGSIYAAFGSKEGLFKEALKFYVEDSYEQLIRFTKTYSPLQALKEFFISVVLCNEEQHPSEVCMLVKTLTELPPENAELIDDAKGYLKGMEDLFADLLTQAQDHGELDKSKDTRRLARYLQMQLMGLRTYARTNTDETNVKDLIEDVFSSI
ncbi:MAG: TetR/AcrR family transcriptional regulator [Neptuniibacter sp.]